MDPFAQTRTSRGEVPCRAVVPVADGEPCEPGRCTAFRFEPEPPADAPGEAPAPVESPDGLLDLAMCVTQGEGGIEVSREALLALARRDGPLMGRSTEESLLAWSSAALVASLALVLQEVANGSLPPQGVATLGNLAKRRVANPATGAGFDLVSVSRLVGTGYASWLCGGAAFVRREPRDGRINYTFLLTEELDEGTSALDVICASFDREMSRSDYLALSRAMEFGDEVDAEVRDRLGAGLVAAETDAGPVPAETGAGLVPAETGGGSSGPHGFTADEELLGEEAPVVEADRGVLASVVRTLVAAHLRDARVDVFAADERTGHLSFQSRLSWLWYDFSRRLDVARIGYCAWCRRPFSLVGHRGMDRRFCSEACKTAAKNERARRRRDALRREFLAGETVEGVAARHFPGEGPAAARAKVVRALETWPALKHEVDGAIGREGWRAPLLARLRAEGLDVGRLLTSARREELRRRARDAR